MKKRNAFLSAAVFAAFVPAAATAQTIDYGALEQLFGQSVTTSATGLPQHESDVPVDMEIITADEIRRSGASDIPGVLKHVIGVDVMRWNNDNADVGVRGYDEPFSPRVLVLIDGRQVYADHYNYTPWTALPVELSAIRQIEVVKGPNAALFGFNAANGVINIVTYNPIYDDVNTASLRGGTQGLAEATAVKTFKFKDGGVRLSAGGRLDDDFSTPVPAAAGLLPRRRNDRFEIDADGVFQLTPNTQLGLEASHSTADSNEFDPVYTLDQDHHDTSSVKGQLTAETGLGLIQATAYLNLISQHLMAAVPVQFEGKEGVVQLQDLFKIGTNHTFRAGLEYRHNDVNTSPFAGGHIFYSDYAASAMWDWDIVPGLLFNTALRWENLHLGRSGAAPAGYPFPNDAWNRTVNEISYSSGLVWKASDADTFRLIFGQGDQLPSLANLGALVISSPVGNFSGAPDIDSANVYNYEASWNRDWPGIGGQFRGSLFYTTSDHMILPVFEIPLPGSGTPPYVTPGNAGDSSARGIELSLDGRIGEAWRWGINYRLESITDDFIPAIAGGKAYFDFEHVAPKHVVKANLGWSSGPWEIDSYAYYQSPTEGLETLPLSQGSFLSPVPDFLSFDARVAYRLTEWATVALSGQNLGASSQRQTSGPAVERRVFVTFSVYH